MDINCKTKYDVPMWSETRWAGCYNPEQGVGLFLHAGRLRGNVDWWWAQTAIYLPGGRVAVDRSWVKNPDEIGVKTPTLDLRAEKTGWSANFDDVAHIANTEFLAKATGGSSAPTLTVQFNVKADGSRPMWDMYSGKTETQDFADMHIEQMGKSKGTLQVDEETYSLGGISYYDHSSGVRDWTHFHSHHFALIAMPDCTIHIIGIYGNDGLPRPAIGAWFTTDGKQLKIEHSEMPRLDSVLGVPLKFDFVIKPDGGEKQTYKVEVLHNFPMTITFDNDNINGIDWELPGDPLFLTECQVKVVAPDGSVGYGHIERSNRRSSLLAINANT